MFIKDINIFWYIGIGLLGLLVGQFLGVINYSLTEHKKIFSVENLKKSLQILKSNYYINLIMCFIYLMILFFIGASDWVKVLEYVILSPMLVSAFVIDYKLQIIPSRLTLTMWEAGIIFSFIRGLNNLNAAVEMWIGMLLGAGIFFILTFLGNLIFKKETMGFGDVKLMGAIGLFLGWRRVIAVALLCFFIAAIYSIVLIIVYKIKKKNLEEFIPFGPFIVIASFVVMFVPFNVLLNIPFFIFTLGRVR